MSFFGDFLEFGDLVGEVILGEVSDFIFLVPFCPEFVRERNFSYFIILIIEWILNENFVVKEISISRIGKLFNF